MKKSFKKAGAAVLSMAMLLSMGAVSLPVFAAQPGYVEVKLGTGRQDYQGQGDHKNDKDATNGQYMYEYLDSIQTATSTMYRVAKFGTDGWTWESALDVETDAANYTSTDEKFEYKLEELLEQDANGKFIADSTELQRLASFLERQIDGLSPQLKDTLKVDSGSLNLADGLTTNDTIQLPSTDPKLTANEIGYYLIVTETNDSGVIIQPVLISLKNEDNTTTPAKRTVSLKGSRIAMYKDIVDVYDTETEFKQTHKDGNKDASNISESKSSASVALHDTIVYRISAQMPKYDVNVDVNDIVDFAITDTAEKGIDLPLSATELADTDTFVVWISGNDERNVKASERTTADNVTLIYGKDYTVATDTSSNSFTVSINGNQMRGNVQDGALAQSLLTNKKMDNMFIHIEFKATVDPTQFRTGVAGVSRAADTEYSAFTAANLKSTEAQQTTGTAPNGTSYVATVPGKGSAASAATEDYADILPTVKALVASDSNLNVLTDEELITRAKNYMAAHSETAVTDLTIDNLKSGDATSGGATASGSPAVAATADTDPYATLAALFKDSPKGALYNMVQADDDLKLLTVDQLVLRAYNYHIYDSDQKEKAYQDALAAAPYGNKNEADLEFGNQYATGKGHSTDHDETKVVGVNLDLTKLVNNLSVEYEKVTPATADKYFTKAYLDAYYSTAPSGLTVATDLVTAVRTSDTDRTPVTLTAEYQQRITKAIEDYNAVIDEIQNNAATDPFTATTVGSAVTTATDLWKIFNFNDVAAAKKVPDSEVSSYPDDLTVGGVTSNTLENKKKIYRLVEKVNALRNTDGGYIANANDVGVEGAVFQLSKKLKNNSNSVQNVPVKDPTDTYEYVGSDADGKLFYLQPDANGTYKYNNAKYSLTGTPAFKILSDGEYVLEELYTPTGYKQWEEGATFTVSNGMITTTNAKDGTGNKTEYGPTFTATANGSQFVKGNTAANVTFNYDSTTGTLSHDIFNDLQDKLPATGGIGTVLFTAGGISVVLIAGALFVMYMKKKNSEEEE